MIDFARPSISFAVRATDTKKKFFCCDFFFSFSPQQCQVALSSDDNDFAFNFLRKFSMPLVDHSETKYAEPPGELRSFNLFVTNLRTTTWFSSSTQFISFHSSQNRQLIFVELIEATLEVRRHLGREIVEVVEELIDA